MHISECLLWINRKYGISISFQKIIPALDFIIDQYFYSIQLYKWAYVHFNVLMYFSTLLRIFYVVFGHLCILVLLHTFLQSWRTFWRHDLLYWRNDLRLMSYASWHIQFHHNSLKNLDPGFFCCFLRATYCTCGLQCLACHNIYSANVMK